MTAADLHPAIIEHQIIGTQTGQQGAGQVVPEDSVLCTKCGWMRCSDYTWHLSDALTAAVRARIAADIRATFTDPERLRPRDPEGEFATDLLNDWQWAALIAEGGTR